MALFNDIYCQICDRFISKEQGNKHLYSSSHLHREVIGLWPALFPQRKLTNEEGVITEKSFWEMIVGSEDVLHVYSFLKTYFMMVLNMRILEDHVPLDLDDDDADLRYGYRHVIIAQFEQDLYNKIFSLQDQSKWDQIDTLQNGIKSLLNNIDDTGFQYLTNFKIMLIATKDWIILFAVQIYFLRLDI